MCSACFKEKISHGNLHALRSVSKIGEKFKSEENAYKRNSLRIVLEVDL